MKGEYISIETLKMYQEIEKENKELHEKIDKAIEYVNTWLVDEYSICVPDKEYPDTACVYEPKAIDNLLNILNGDSNE